MTDIGSPLCVVLAITAKALCLITSTLPLSHAPSTGPSKALICIALREPQGFYIVGKTLKMKRGGGDSLVVKV